MATIVSFGEVVWDIFPSGKYLGGAPFNFAANARRLGHEVLFVSAVGQDELGSATLNAIRAAGLTDKFVRRSSEASTGTVHVQFDDDNQPHYTINRPAAYDFISLDDNAIKSIAECRPEFLYFGTLSQLYESNCEVFAKLTYALPDALRFFDVNLRKDSFNLVLLEQLLSTAQVVKMNEEEAELIHGLFGASEISLEAFCRTYSRKFGWRAVWVTRGAAGCSVYNRREFMEFPGFPVAAPNPVGAGDAFAAAVCHGMSKRWPIAKIAQFANRVGALVAKHPGAICDWSVNDLRDELLEKQVTPLEG